MSEDQKVSSQPRHKPRNPMHQGRSFHPLSSLLCLFQQLPIFPLRRNKCLEAQGKRQWSPFWQHSAWCLGYHSHSTPCNLLSLPVSDSKETQCPGSLDSMDLDSTDKDIRNVSGQASLVDPPPSRTSGKHC